MSNILLQGLRALRANRDEQLLTQHVYRANLIISLDLAEAAWLDGSMTEKAARAVGSQVAAELFILTQLASN